MKTVTVLSRKGGTGKTTLACSLAVAAERSNSRAVIIDLDPQVSALAWSQVRTSATPAVLALRAGNLNHTLRALAGDGTQYAFIDTPAGFGAGSAQTAVKAADLVLIPCRPGLFDLAAISASVAAAHEAGVRAAVVFTLAGVRSPLIAQAIEAVTESGLDYAPIIFHNRVAHLYAVADGLTAAELDAGSKAAAETQALWSWLRNEMRGES